MTSNDDFTEQELHDLLGELLQAWQTDRGPAIETKAHVAVVGTVYALTAHAHRLGSGVALLSDSGMQLEAVPLARGAFEAALTASWIAQVPDALPAYLNRQGNQQRALRDTMLLAKWIREEDKFPVPADEAEPYLVSKGSKDSANYTITLCKDLVLSDHLYSLYRGLSWLTHPSVAVTDYYLQLTDGADVPTLRPAPDLEDDFMRTWLFITCSSLVWSARALNLQDAKRAKLTTERNRLRAAADRLGISPLLKANQDAVHRGTKSERDRAMTTRPTPS